MAVALHVSGLDVEQIALDVSEYVEDADWVTPEFIDRVIRGWRASGFTPSTRLAAPYEVFVTCSQLYRILAQQNQQRPLPSRSVAALPPDFARHAQLNLTMPAGRHALDGEDRSPPSIEAPAQGALSRPFPHLRRLRKMWDESSGGDVEPVLRELMASLSMAEWMDCIGEDDLLVAVSRVLDTSQRVVTIPYVEWCDVNKIPEVVLERVVTGGARHFHYSTGTLHSWVVTAINPPEYETLRRLWYAADALGVDISEDGLTLTFDARPSAEATPRFASMYYRSSSHSSLVGVSLMAVTGIIRLELVTASPTGLKCLAVRPLVLPRQLRLLLGEWVMRMCDDQQIDRFDEAAERHEGANLDAKYRFLASENARFEQFYMLSSLPARGSLTPDLRRELEAARIGLLSVLARESLAPQGVMLSPESRAAFETFSSLLADWHTAHPRHIDERTLADQLDDGSVAVHLEYRDGRVDAVCAWKEMDRLTFARAPSGAPERERLETMVGRWRDLLVGRGPHLPELLDALDQVIAAGVDCLRPIVAVLEKQRPNRVLLSPGAGFGGIPIHAALARAGVKCPVLYIPSLTIMANVPQPEQLPNLLLVAHPSEQDPLMWVERESKALAAVYHPTTVTARADHLFERSAGIIHVSCHGATAADFAMAGLLLADPNGRDYWVSSAEILGRGNFAGARLIVLSACSTGGLIDHRTSVQSFGGVDMAFIGSGASTVASTLWTVYDVVTSVFSLAFHLRLKSGDSVIQAHTVAVSLLQQRVDDWPTWLVAAASERLAGSLDSIRQLPGWPHPLYWASFRVLLGSRPMPANEGDQRAASS